MLPRPLQLLRLLALGVCLVAPVVQAQDDLAPLIEHAPPGWVPEGKPLKLRAKVTSLSGRPVVAEVYVRPPGLPSYTPITLQPVKGLTAVLQAELPGDLLEGVVDYYIESYDADGNGPGLAGTSKSPLRIHTYAGDTAPTTPPPADAVATPAAVDTMPVPDAALAAPESPEPAPSLLQRAPMWAWGLVGGTVLAAAGAAAFQLQAASIVGADRPTTSAGVTTHSISQSQGAQANTASLLGTGLGVVALGCAAGAAVGFLLEF